MLTTNYLHSLVKLSQIKTVSLSVHHTRSHSKTVVVIVVNSYQILLSFFQVMDVITDDYVWCVVVTFFWCRCVLGKGPKMKYWPLSMPFSSMTHTTHNPIPKTLFMSSSKLDIWVCTLRTPLILLKPFFLHAIKAEQLWQYCILSTSWYQDRH